MRLAGPCLAGDIADRHRQLAGTAGRALTRHDSGSRQVLYTASLRVEVLRMQSCIISIDVI